MSSNPRPDPERSAQFEAQYRLQMQDYLLKLDFLNWYRYWFIFAGVIRLGSHVILEAGPGEGFLKNALAPLVEDYKTLDINQDLKPDYLGDIRDRQGPLAQGFDCVIAADILEHIPFADLPAATASIHSYVRPGGAAIITIPHRRSNFLFMTPTQVPHVVTVPTGFLSPGAFYRRFIKRKIWTDPHHCWEIGDGQVRRADVERTFRDSGFALETFKKLIYVDFWVLRKN